MHNYAAELNRKTLATARKAAQEITRTIPDPRKPRGIRYPFGSLLECIILAVLHGYDDVASMTRFIATSPLANKRLPGKKPQRTTVALLLEKLEGVSGAFFVPQLLCDDKIRRVLHVDGKSLCASHGPGLRPLHILNACASNGTPVAQVPVDRKTNEMTATLQLLKALPLKGMIFTADALLTQKGIAELICSQEGNYIFLAKKNQLYLFAECGRQMERDDLMSVTTVDHGHGRIEERTISVATHCPNLPLYFPYASQAFKIVTTRYTKSTRKTETSVHYGITSLTAEQASPEFLLRARRKHWSVESKLHWVLDLTFSEDRCRVRNRAVASVLSAFRKMAIGIFISAGCRNIKEGIQLLQTAT